MRTETCWLPSAGGGRQFARLWLPDAPPRAVLLIAHGLSEYGGRYDAFARWLAERGYAVAAADHMGHGHSDGTAQYPRHGTAVMARVLAVEAALRGEQRQSGAAALAEQLFNAPFSPPPHRLRLDQPRPGRAGRPSCRPALRSAAVAGAAARHAARHRL